ncbi:8-amino-7-oxononanoate synthase [Rhabdochromatium marinum]|uniref:8-amino-7-oxononanoate synthase n=1 Tax=Rhabdochromatium marinum TaxID=48729 RepID=UPI00190819CE|nr:8-amino-7-oxononanoate synthase [Rhabdochromatium marinum]MBK1649495.1 8-amino-7-oxononanoate synthase [Rhabdochromatium marinum]
MTLTAELADLSARHLYRRRRCCDSAQAPRMQVEGRSLLTFCSNDYLGLAGHPQVVHAFQHAADDFGVGSGASHLINGHSRYHQQLEEALADFVERPRALLFSTGYMANLGVISALAGRGEQILCDRLNHASLIDGARLSGARMRRYRHLDTSDLERLLGSPGADTSQPIALIASDGIFSMDGDCAPVPELVAAAQRAGAWLLIDDAHGLGVTGPGGRGTLASFGLDDQQVPILVGTLGKAFGTFGAFVAGSEALIETLIQRARSYLYTTALPPAVAAASLAALELVQREDWRREQLQALIAQFRQGAAELGLRRLDSNTPIQPLLAGETAQALDWSQRLEAQGLLVPAIRPPTVPQGQARLRISFSANHQPADVERLLDALAGLPDHPSPTETPTPNKAS